MPKSKVNPKAKLKHGDVTHADSSSVNKNVMNKAISAVSKSARTKTIEESSVNSNEGSNVTGKVEFEGITTSNVEIEKNELTSSGDGNFVPASSLLKRESSMVSLAGYIDKLEVDDYEPSGATSDYDEPPKANTNEPPEATSNDPPGATNTDIAGAATTNKPQQPQIRNVLGEIELQNPGQENGHNEENRKEFIEKFLTENTFNNC
ncbi:44145_t:CDS:2, partial [Gigaspora margarita]